jgi:hypothetical protein
MRGLGGLRRAQPDSANLGWRNTTHFNDQELVDVTSLAAIIKCVESSRSHCERYPASTGR